ncbi:MAG TPA: peptidylprolyl isomerase [Bacillota bacterium]|nr:peptidylprolyl isomerase [Bacillota bacterium]
MKKLAMAFAISASMLLLAACGGDKESSDPDVVAKTKSGDISKEDFYEALKERYGEEVLYDLITTEVLSGNFEISDEEVDAEIDHFKEQLGDQFELWMMQEGFSDEEELRELIKVSMLQEEAITSDIEISDEEVEEYYNDIKVEKEARHILVEDPELAEDLKKQLDDGADFAELAKENSTDSSAEEGGDIGYFSKDSNLVPEFLDTAYALDVDEISEPVESQFGFHIIQVTDSREKEDFASLEDMKKEISRTLKSEKVDQAEAQEKIQQILDDAEIDIKIEEFKDLFEQPEVLG